MTSESVSTGSASLDSLEFALKFFRTVAAGGNLGPAASSRPPPVTALARFSVRLMYASSVRCACDDIRKFVRSSL